MTARSVVIYLYHQNQQSGPYAEATFRELVAKGKVPPGALLWHEGAADWMPVADYLAKLARAEVESAVTLSASGAAPLGGESTGESTPAPPKAGSSLAWAKYLDVESPEEPMSAVDSAIPEPAAAGAEAVAMAAPAEPLAPAAGAGLAVALILGMAWAAFGAATGIQLPFLLGVGSTWISAYAVRRNAPPGRSGTLGWLGLGACLVAWSVGVMGVMVAGRQPHIGVWTLVCFVLALITAWHTSTKAK